ncbi:hypothetical protein ACOME3_004296 [Neoechinorhynchus agilis]
MSRPADSFSVHLKFEFFRLKIAGELIILFVPLMKLYVILPVTKIIYKIPKIVLIIPSSIGLQLILDANIDDDDDESLERILAKDLAWVRLPSYGLNHVDIACLQLSKNQHNFL